jgi:hypothetical protein
METRFWRRIAAVALIAFMLAVLPANIHAAQAGVTLRGAPATPIIPRVAFSLRDAEASYTVDLATSSITRHDDRRLGGTFVGSFDEDASANWRFIASTERGELPTEFPGR